MAYLDPTKHRLSDAFLLSDFMGCDSVYRRGYPNAISHDDTEKLEQGEHLANSLEYLQGHFGVCRVVYGYISPSLSGKIVKYQDPDKPSYHRWDAGAAADVWFPEVYVGKTEFETSPVAIAHEIDNVVPYSRMITYSESDCICFATNLAETPHRRAFYENRYLEDQEKPHFVRYSPNLDKRDQQKQESAEFVRNQGWKGQGWPRYHGGGRLQYEHQKIGQHFSVIDFLYNKYNVLQGRHNRPPVDNGEPWFEYWCVKAAMAGMVLHRAQQLVGNRVSVTSAYNRWEEVHSWKERFTLEFSLPLSKQGMSEIVVECLRELPYVAKAWVVEYDGETRIRVNGRRG